MHALTCCTRACVSCWEYNLCAVTMAMQRVIVLERLHCYLLLFSLLFTVLSLRIHLRCYCYFTLFDLLLISPYIPLLGFHGISCLHDIHILFKYYSNYSNYSNNTYCYDRPLRGHVVEIRTNTLCPSHLVPAWYLTATHADTISRIGGDWENCVVDGAMQPCQ